jgi:hypothetical protein
VYPKLKISSAIFICLFLSLFWASRDSIVGSDTSSYQEIFSSVLSIADAIPEKDNIDYGYKIYIATIKLFTSDIYVFQLVTLFVIYFCLLFALKMFTSLYFEVFVLTILSKSFLMYVVNIQRQGIALSISMLAIALLVKGRYLCFCMVSLVSFFFHSSSIMFTAMAFMIWLFKGNRYLLVFFFFLMICIFISIKSHLILPIMGMVSVDTQEFMKLLSYMQASQDGVSLGIGFFLSVLMVFSAKIYSWFRFKMHAPNDVIKLNFCIVLCFINLSGVLILNDFGVLVRVFSYILPLEFYCYVWVASNFNKNGKYIILVNMILAAFYGVYGNIYSGMLNAPLGWL